MGVQGLWELLAPVGRRVSVETLAGKKLAIDASIWMVQFMKAMRDEKGEMVRNAHLLGFFRRICKLLFLRTRPVFVFDGGTPSLKRRTIAARRRHRDNARAKIRKTAEKLLLNHLKAKKLEELAEEIKRSSRQKEDPKGKRVMSEHEDGVSGGCPQKGDETSRGGSISQQHLDELLAASLAAEEEGKFTLPVSEGELHPEEETDGDDGEEMAFPVIDGNVDPTVLASLPPSMQLDLLVQMRERLMAENRQKYQKIKKSPSKFSELQIQSYLKTVAFRREIDEVQKCAAGRGPEGVQTSRIASEANREFIFSSSFTGDKKNLTSARVEKSGNMEPHVMEKETVLSNSTKFHSSTSQLISASGTVKDFGHDVETYRDERGCIRLSRVRGLGIRMTRDLQRNLDLLKERELEDSGENVQKETEPICHNDMCGIPEISSDNGNPLIAMKEKEGHSGGINGDTGALTQEIGKSCSYEVSTAKSGTPIEILPSADVSGHKDADNDPFLRLTTANPTLKFSSGYFPSNGSESDYVWKERVTEENVESSKNKDLGESQLSSRSEEDDVDWEEGGLSQEIGISHSYELSTLKSGTPIEISFSADDSGYNKDVDDDLFLQLAAGNSTLKLSSEIDFEDKTSSDFETHCVGEERIEEKVESSKNHRDNGSQFSVGETVMSEEEEVDWEEGYFQIGLPLQTEHEKAVSRGVLEEEADIQEAIRRSLEDLSQIEIIESHQGPGHEKRRVDSSPVPLESELQRITTQNATVDGRELLDSADRNCIQQAVDSSEKQLSSSKLLGDHSDELYMMDEPSGSSQVSSHGHITKSVADGRILGKSHIDKDPTNELAGQHITQQERSSEAYTMGENKASLGKPMDVSYQASSPICVARTENIDKEHVPAIQKDFDISLEEHCSYDTSTQDHKDVQIEVSEAMLDKEKFVLRQELKDLGEQQRRLERNAESVSSEMFAECQELLQMFGLPFIIAPMEAEAQCAYMEMINLVDGVVTDDSDVFLFGARSVYKNIFDDRKYVETYLMKDIESELGLPREMLIRMALLLGSDYTEGVSGIGIVNAIEVVHAFPEEDGLRKFREWLESPDPSILGKLDPHVGNNSKKRLAKASSNAIDGCGNDTEGSVCDKGNLRGNDDQNLDAKRIFMSKHRNISKNWHISSSFPSDSVVSAYINPQIDESTESFAWGKPDLPLLRKLCWERFGWSNQRADELLMPVLKEFNKRETQLRLEAFYTFNEKFAKIRSQRIKKAVKGIAGDCSKELMDDLVQGDADLKKKKRRMPPSAADENKFDNHFDVKTDNGRTASKQSSLNVPQNMLLDEGQAELPVQNRKAENVIYVLGANRERGMGTRKRRGKGRGKGRGREECSFESAESGSSDSASLSAKDKKQLKMAGTSKLRRSTRQKKQVQYVEENRDAGELTDLPNKRSGTCSDEPAVEQELDDNKSNHSMGMDKQMLDESRTEDDTAKDYLLSGGGFCADDGDINGNHNKPILSGQGPSAEPLTESTDASIHLEISSRDNVPRMNFEEPSQGISPTSEETGLLTGRLVEGEANSCLSAMTSLRRKRRKF